MQKGPITQHNQYRQTDTLYDPLRYTLKKSNSSDKINCLHHLFYDQLRGSVISRDIHEISPEEAARLERQIMIPINRRLKPTSHHEKIQGKKFVAISVSQKSYQPLNQQEFMKLKNRQGLYEETVYQLSSQNPSTSGSVKQSPSPKYYQRFNTQQPNQQDAPYFYEYGVKANGENFSNKRCFEEGNNLLPKQYDQIKESYYDQHFFRSEVNPVNLEGKPVQKKRYTYQGEGMKEKQGNNHGQQIDFNQIVRATVPHQQNNEYRFKSGTFASSGFKSESGHSQDNQGGKIKPTYKYNLFSAVDEGVNTKCTSFGKNQLIARQINNKKW